MKDLITTIASLMILMSFVVMFVSCQMAFENAMAVEYYSNEISVGNMTGEEAMNHLANFMGCSKNVIAQNENNHGEIEIKVPVKYILGTSISKLDESLSDNNRYFIRKVAKYEEPDDEKTDDSESEVR